jgi:hypothetical protein
MYKEKAWGPGLKSVFGWLQANESVVGVDAGRNDIARSLSCGWLAWLSVAQISGAVSWMIANIINSAIVYW